MGEAGADCRFVAVVGPSGSGKSSLVRAGLVPALRAGALPGSEGWFVVEMVPGAQPFEELAAGVERIAVDPRPGLRERIEGDDEGLLRAAGEILPSDGSELLLVIDQFEEVFSLVEDEDERARFLDAVVAVVDDPRSRVRVVVTLRADFYDRPLLYSGFGDLLARRTYAVTPLSGDELERAVSGPAEAVGVRIEPGLLTEIVAEVRGRPGTLPLLQYALTELFEGRRDSALTLQAYREVGGASGALARRAEALYGRLNERGREAARQLFLRLVAVGEDGQENTRRRVLRSELASLEVDRGAIDGVIDAFGARRLLSFDRDEHTRGPTVEVAHEALLVEWGRLRDWLEASREELRLSARVTAATREWEEAARSGDYLLTGSRLGQAAEAMERASIRLTQPEREYLEASMARREAERRLERARQAREVRLERRAMSRLRAMVSVLAIATLIASGLTVVAVSRSREAVRLRDEATVAGLTGAALSNLRTDPDLSLLLTLHAVSRSASLGEPVPAATVEALHWAIQESGIQYPTTEARSVAVVGPLGVRGVFDLPIGELVDLARAHVGRALSSAECAQYLRTATCPSLPGRFPADLSAEPVRALSTGGARPLAGTRVTLANPSEEQAWRERFLEDVAAFTERTGIEIRLVGTAGFHHPAGESLVVRDVPDIGLVPGPGSVVELAREGALMDIGAYVDVDRLRQEQSPYLVSLGTIGADGSWPSDTGRTYAAFFQLNVKSLVWYPVPELRATGHAIPRTWDELVALGDRLRDEGRTPWCFGFESDVADGWPGTDWIEDLLLGGAGPDAYDRWSFHELPFDSPEVRTAFERLGRIVFPEGSLYHSIDGALSTSYAFAQLPMVDREPPACWLYHFPSFGANLLPGGALLRETNVFPFPQVDPRFANAVVGGGDQEVVFTDRPEVREVLRFLLSPEFGTALAARGQEGFISANRRFDVDTYPPFWRQQAETVYAALAVDRFRFDASDLMPPEIGAGAFWKAMMTYLREGPASLDRILAELDAAWPDDG